jgi:nucleoside-diphosphate-sugar epimerase
VTRALAAEGHDVLALVRSPGKEDAARDAGAELVRGELAKPGVWRDAAASCDAIVHAALEYSPGGRENARLDRIAVEALLAAAWAGSEVRQLV